MDRELRYGFKRDRRRPSTTAYVVEIDRSQDLGPQLAAARKVGCPWKILQQLTGLSRPRLASILGDFEFTELSSRQICKPESPRVSLIVTRTLILK